ncbi:MAG: hypothetical protein BGO45_05060 [Microbacterium sp. 71-36]|nr:MAG: hypothetical protein ABS60_06605 [Microbacterium sp. SCN 71-17]OJV75074.1 MAG: hypothetical protein BGO45_05060 [Microbacterium sp. 71-36]
MTGFTAWVTVVSATTGGVSATFAPEESITSTAMALEASKTSPLYVIDTSAGVAETTESAAGEDWTKAS